MERNITPPRLSWCELWFIKGEIKGHKQIGCTVPGCAKDLKEGGREGKKEGRKEGRKEFIKSRVHCQKEKQKWIR